MACASLYLLAAAFMVAAALTDQVVRTLTLTPAPHLKAGPLFPVFVFYAFSASALSVFNVYRARKRCLTFWTRRRMTYMLISILTPMVGVFPYTSVGTYGVADGPWFWFLVNLSNVAVIVMLSFMAYPLAFFGSEVPDRVIKAELLEFFLRGPFVGVATLSVIMGLPRAGEILGLPGRESMPLAAVASLIFLEWAVTRVLPVLKNWLIYQDDKAEIERLRELSERLLTHSDLEQLLEGILASACDYLRVPSAFVAASTADGPVLEQSVGMLPDSAVTPEALVGVVEALTLNGANGAHPADHVGNMIAREGFWLIPLWHEPNGEANGRTLFGVMGVHARTTPPALTPEEQGGAATVGGAQRAGAARHAPAGRTRGLSGRPDAPDGGDRPVARRHALPSGAICHPRAARAKHRICQRGQRRAQPLLGRAAPYRQQTAVAARGPGRAGAKRRQRRPGAAHRAAPGRGKPPARRRAEHDRRRMDALQHPGDALHPGAQGARRGAAAGDERVGLLPQAARRHQRGGARAGRDGVQCAVARLLAGGAPRMILFPP
ncbi:MAG: hypothetical protein M5R40_27785 [Anaerolineae bacterium]|nr:hypothetical protein [Anaerolineae bacterium]